MTFEITDHVVWQNLKAVGGLAAAAKTALGIPTKGPYAEQQTIEELIETLVESPRYTSSGAGYITVERNDDMGAFEVHLDLGYIAFRGEEGSKNG